LLLKHLYKQDWKSIFIKLLLHPPDDFIHFTLNCPHTFYNKIPPMPLSPTNKAAYQHYKSSLLLPLHRKKITIRKHELSLIVLKQLILTK